MMPSPLALFRFRGRSKTNPLIVADVDVPADEPSNMLREAIKRLAPRLARVGVPASDFETYELGCVRG